MLTPDQVPANILEKIPENFWEKIIIYHQLIVKWSKKVNLISDLEKNDFFERHVLDSLQLISFIKKDQTILDLGSGSGLPGIILSLAGIEKVTLVESNRKKAVFLKEASFALGCKIRVCNERVEKLTDIEGDIITARAFSSIAEIVEITDNIRKNDQKYLLLKGKKYLLELEELKNKYDFEAWNFQSITDKEGRIVGIEKLVKKTSDF